MVNILLTPSRILPQLTQQIYGQSLELFSKTWTDSFETELQDIISNIAREITDLRDGKEIDFAQKIKEYVDAHCYEQALSINVIAEEFGFSPSYITRFFRLQTGYTLKDYIDKQRMERASLLLATSSLNAQRICGGNWLL